jgi:hypothetical protein
MPGTMIDYAEMIVEEYAETVRKNGAQAAVDAADDWEIWYELMEVLSEHNCPWLSESTTDAMSNDFYGVLGAVLAGWRVGLHGQVALESAWRAWKEQT